MAQRSVHEPRIGISSASVALLTLWFSQGAGADGTWPMERHDTRNTGATELRGRITQPEVWWDHYLGPPHVDRAATDAANASALHDLDGDGRQERVEVGGRKVAVKDATGRVLWSYTVPGRSGISPHCFKVARVLPGSKGKQILAASARMDTGEGYAWCFAFEDGADRGRVVWQTENLTGMHGPEGIVADIDGDGRMEFCLAPHYRVLILDAVTGKIKHTVKWDVGRNYGLFAAEDVDGDGCRELLVVCDFVLHVDLIDVSPGGRVKLGWSRRFIPGTQFDGARQVYIHAGLNALADLDGDGRWEIWLNLFNHDKDGQWHVHVMDARTGKVRCDLAGWYVCGSGDLDGDGRLEIVAMRCRRQRPAAFGKMAVLRFADERIRQVAALDRVRPVLTNALPPAHVASNVDDGYRGVLLSDHRLFAIGSSDGRHGDVLLALELAGDRLVERGRYAAPGAELDVLSLTDGSDGARLAVRDVIKASRRELDRDLRPVGEYRPDTSPGFVAAPIVADLGGGRPAIVVPNSAGQIVALAHRDSSGPKEIWRAPGRGMTQSAGYSKANRGVVAADVDGDGRDEIICSHHTAGGDGTIRVLRRDGTVLWEHAFDRLPVGGLEASVDLWSVGRFSKRKGLDIWVTVHRASKVSSESYVLSGVDGREVWNIKTATADTGPGGKVSRCFGQAWPFIADVDGDGLDEIGMCPYEIYTVTRGIDGRHAIGPLWLLNKAYFGRWLAYFSPTLVDLDGNGKLDVFLNTASCTAGGVGAIRLDGSPMYVHWHDNATGCGSFQAAADVDGDGHVEIGASHIDGRFRCYRGSDGTVRWEHKLPPGGCSHVVAADVDGDGQGEFVFVGPDSTLYALRGGRDAPKGRVAWKLPLGTTGTPIVADVDGDGSAEVLLVGGDGRLRVIGQASVPHPASKGKSSASPSTVSVSGHAFHFGPAGGRVEGARVSVLERPDLKTVTGKRGAWRFDGLTPGREATFVLERQGYMTTQTATFKLGAEDLKHVSFQVPPHTVVAGFGFLLGYTPDPNYTQLASTVTRVGESMYGSEGPTHGEPGATVTIDPPLPRKHGPIYFNLHLFPKGSQVIWPDRRLTETTKDGGVLFIDVPAGEYTLRAHKKGVAFTPVKVKCRPGVLVNPSPPCGLQAKGRPGGVGKREEGKP